MASYLDRVEPIIVEELEQLGFKLVEIHELFSRSDYMLTIVVWKLKGVTIDDCVAITNAIMPRLEKDKNIPNTVRLQLSSPGVGRKLKHLDELQIFIGRGVIINTVDHTYTGTIISATNLDVDLDTVGITTKIALPTVTSAKLLD